MRIDLVRRRGRRRIGISMIMMGTASSARPSRKSTPMATSMNTSAEVVKSSDHARRLWALVADEDPRHDVGGAEQR